MTLFLAKIHCRGRFNVVSLGETGASWYKIAFFLNSDVNVNLLLLVWHFTLRMIIFISYYIVFSLYNETFEQI